MFSRRSRRYEANGVVGFVKQRSDSPESRLKARCFRNSEAQNVNKEIPVNRGRIRRSHEHGSSSSTQDEDAQKISGSLEVWGGLWDPRGEILSRRFPDDRRSFRGGSFWWWCVSPRRRHWRWSRGVRWPEAAAKCGQSSAVNSVFRSMGWGYFLFYF